MFYGTDSGVLSNVPQTLQTLYGSKLDLVIREGTWCGTSKHSSHLSVSENAAERQDLINPQTITSSTPWYLTHLDWLKCSLPSGIIGAHDGLTFTIPVL